MQYVKCFGKALMKTKREIIIKLLILYKSIICIKLVSVVNLVVSISGLCTQFVIFKIAYVTKLK